MLHEVLPDPRALLALKGEVGFQTLHIHRPIPKTVPVGHFDDAGREIVDETINRAAYIERIQRACATLGEGLEIRFYDHFDDEFDASVLDHLDEIRRLSVDGLSIARHPEAIGRLPKLTSLRFEPRQVDSAKVLGVLGVHRLQHLTLAGTPTPMIDLSPLADARSLRSLRLLGRAKNTEAIGHATGLIELAIRPSTKVALDFVNRLESLEVLKFVLGEAASIRAIESLTALRDLSFREVRNLVDVGDLQRFPCLRRLQLSDLPKIAELHTGRQNKALEHLYLYSVPRLRMVAGFSDLPAVKSLFAYDSQLNLPWASLPRTLTHFQLVTKAVKGRAAHDAEAHANGLIPAPHPDADFFYK